MADTHRGDLEMCNTRPTTQPNPPSPNICSLIHSVRVMSSIPHSNHFRITTTSMAPSVFLIICLIPLLLYLALCFYLSTYFLDSLCCSPTLYAFLMLSFPAGSPLCVNMRRGSIIFYFLCPCVFLFFCLFFNL